MSNGLPPLAEVPLCVGTLAGAYGLYVALERTVGRWLRGERRFRPPVAPEAADRQEPVTWDLGGVYVVQRRGDDW